MTSNENGLYGFGDFFGTWDLDIVSVFDYKSILTDTQMTGDIISIILLCQ